MERLFGGLKTLLSPPPKRFDPKSGMPAHVTLFKNQFRRLEDNKERPFPTPAVFIEFLNIVYDTGIAKGQTCKGIVRLHLAQFNLEVKDEFHFQFRKAVHKKVQGFYDSEGYWTPLTRVAENPDPEFDNMTVWTMDYEFEAVDDDAMEVLEPHIIAHLEITRE